MIKCLQSVKTRLSPCSWCKGSYWHSCVHLLILSVFVHATFNATLINVPCKWIGSNNNISLLLYFMSHRSHLQAQQTFYISTLFLLSPVPVIAQTQFNAFTCISDVVSWLSVILGPVVSLVLVAGLVVVVHVKWLELKIIYRSHFPLGKHEEGKTANTHTVMPTHLNKRTDSELNCVCLFI